MVGGKPTVEPIPYQVSLQLFIKQFEKNQHFCGGSVLTTRHILTASHCLAGFPTDKMSVVAGTSNWDEGGVRHEVACTELHPDYKELHSSDIGLVTLVMPLEFSKLVK